MKLRAGLRKLLIAFIVSATLVGGGFVAAATPAQAYATTCRVVSLNNSWYPWSAVRPFVQLTVCYNGSQIWQGSAYIYKGVNTWIYNLEGIDWVGTWNQGGSWLGVGLDYRIAWAGVGHWTCNTRWWLDAHGNQTGYSRGC